MIHPALPSDEAAIRACAEQAYAPYIPLIGRPPAPMLADYAAQIAAGQVYVARGAGDELLGFVVLWAEADHVLLENVAVTPAARGQGIGKALIGFCEGEARRLRLPCVRLYTHALMSANLALYPRLGYAETGRRREHGFDRVFFEKAV
ncbi:GNAT family N-acetyltransferase [Pseudomonas sp. NPDC007930]|uniref:GNAT family N-acetyltransferase n=1 Tax=Pseudomonas sp. NPDC007930 TaxID=3364417 RepID=UPI0036E4A8D9